MTTNQQRPLSRRVLGRSGPRAVVVETTRMTPSGHSARRYHFPDHAPLVIRWPNHIKPGTVKNQLFAALDWLPTFVDIAGGPKGDGLKRQIEAGQYSGIEAVRGALLSAGG
jgi:hypothetical protein